MTKKRIALIVLIALLVVLAGVLLVMNSKLNFLFSSPQVSHETLTTPGKTRAVVLVNVPMAKELIARKVQAPGWALPMALPHEAALVVDVDRFVGDIKFQAFVNDKRLGPVICDFVNKIKLPVPYDSWFQDPMRPKQKGVLVREGLTVCNRAIRSTIDKQWRDADAEDVLKVENGHLLEAFIDNRDGSALAIVSVFTHLAAGLVPGANAKEINLNDYLDEMTLQFAAAVSTVRIQVDLVSDAEAAVRLIIECGPSVDPGIVGTLQSMVELGIMQIQQGATAFGNPLQGAVTREGQSIVAAYKVTHVDKLIARL